MANRNRLIFGCGYLGIPIGAGWASQGDEVYGVTRNPKRGSELEAKGIRPIVGDVTDVSSLEGLPAVDTVLIAVGMDRSRYSDIRSIYVDGLRNVLSKLPDETGHLIYISSTGVYGDSGGDWVNEQTPTDPPREGGQACLEAEDLIKSSRFAGRHTILRLAGIYGEARIPMLNAVKNQEWEKLNPVGHLNLIHVEDGAGIVQAVAQQKPFGETFLVSDGQPVLRKQYYEAVASHAQTGPVQWGGACDASLASARRSDKRIDNTKLCRDIEFEFQYSDYQAGLAHAFGGS